LAIHHQHVQGSASLRITWFAYSHQPIYTFRASISRDGIRNYCHLTISIAITVTRVTFVATRVTTAIIRLTITQTIHIRITINNITITRIIIIRSTIIQIAIIIDHLREFLLPFVFIVVHICIIIRGFPYGNTNPSPSGSFSGFSIPFFFSLSLGLIRISIVRLRKLGLGLRCCVWSRKVLNYRYSKRL